MTTKFKGYIFAAVSSITYGTNPSFAVPLYADGMSPTSVLFFRYLLALPVLFIILFFSNSGYAIKRKYVFSVILLGFLMSISSLSLFESYNYMNSGIASTLLFIYPILVSVIMILFFHEKINIITILSLITASLGIFLLYRNEAGESLNLMGVLLVVISSLSYAIYIVYVNVVDLTPVPTAKLIFYQIIIGIVLYGSVALMRDVFTIPASLSQWGNAAGLALFPTVMSFICTTLAIQMIGATPTAILGALEPLTAIVLGVVLLGQTLSERECLGLFLIIVATVLIIAGNSVFNATKWLWHEMYSFILHK